MNHGWSQRELRKFTQIKFVIIREIRVKDFSFVGDEVTSLKSKEKLETPYVVSYNC